MKEGSGKFLHLDKGQVYTGYWKEDIAKNGMLEDYKREEAPNPPMFPIPEVCNETVIELAMGKELKQ